MIKFAVAIFLTLIVYNNCGSNQFSSNRVWDNIPYLPIVTNGHPLSVVGNEENIVAVQVGCGFVNELCVSVTICEPGVNKCQTIPNILLDTGSYGLRVFSSVAHLELNQIIDGNGKALAECQSFADGSSDWGPVVRADVKLGGLTAAAIPVQLIDSKFATPPTDCADLDESPAQTGFNGILGIGHFVQDCGSLCQVYTNNRIYFDCAAGATNCDHSTTIVANSNQVTNPIAAFSSYNNGVIIQLPNVDPSGAKNLTGYMIMGIGTVDNNTPPANVLTFDANLSGNIKTEYAGQTYSAFMDTGSNAYFYPSSEGDLFCASSVGFYCPNTPQTKSAKLISNSGSVSQEMSFQIVSVDIVLNLNLQNNAFNNFAGEFPNYFDWGLPFYFGRTIYHGFENRNSPLGVGPYFAY